MIDSISRRDFLALAGATTLASATTALARGPASYPAPDREMVLPVPGGRVYVRINGDLRGSRPPLVMIHGGPGGSHAAFLDALALADERAIILYDQLDSGWSDKPGDPANWVVPRFVDELEAVRAGLGVRRWHVLGHSWGGTIALEYGARRPTALAGLVPSSALISTRSWLADAAVLRGQMPAGPRETLTACEAANPPVAEVCDEATRAFYSLYNRREVPTDGAIAYRNRQHLQGTGPSLGKKLYETMWGKTEFVSTGTLKDYDGEPLLARLDGRRTLFLCGQYDEARPETVRGFARRVPPSGAAFAEIPGAGHGTFSDQPAATLAVLRPWLTAQDQLG
ncbi:proline iminopeptidase-family hydrolase [Sphingomonas quercus]|uniref:Proline iminopeptidase-family hydrolase n=1 Tax=Sphingomonas quercus TaxID=2842451 RepID=A0ABS6BEU7_9SPHN|nr:proline iminopeptidase-family hydrolase [Sphingomonas quercus]MBU3076835.1 proline iminopeptidase-family hydrolase [Sphingomonas quercus]